MTPHSPEPWRPGKRPGTIVSAPAGQVSVPHNIAESVSPENMRRILACVNAFRHVKTELIEQFGLELVQMRGDDEESGGLKDV